MDTTLLIKRRQVLQAFSCAPLLLSVAACGGTPGQPSYSDLAKRRMFGLGSQPLDREKLEALPYASIIASIGVAPDVLLILGTVQGDRLSWHSSDRSLLHTISGRIVKTAGLPDNVTQTYFGSMGNALEGLHTVTERRETRYIDWADKNQYGMPVYATYTYEGMETVDILGKPHQTKRYREDFTLPVLENWEGTSYFWLDPETGFVWKTEQILLPEVPQFRTAVVKPYLG